MFSLREALQYPCLSRARVVAGAAGLGQVVRRVHVVDIPDANYAWGQGGLLLTAGYGLKDSPERQAAFIPTLVKRGLVGLVLSVGWYFSETPAAICAAAEAHGFPVIEVPPEVEFIAITEQLHAALVNHQFALKERSAGIHRHLTQQVLQGSSLAAVTTTLAQLLQRSVLIESPACDVLAAAQAGPADQDYLQAVETRRTPSGRAQRLRRRGLYADLRQKPRAMRLSPAPDLGWTMERIVAPILVAGEVHGYLWVVAGDRPLTDLDDLVADQAATVTALVMMRELAVRDAQQTLRGDFLSQLLSGREPDSALHEQARALNYRCDQPHQVIVILSPPENGAAAAQLAVRLDQRLHDISSNSLVVLREHAVALLVEAKANSTGQAIAAQLLADLRYPHLPLSIGVGQVHAEDRSLRRSYEEAQEAAEIGLRLGPPARLTCFWELGLLDWLYRLSPAVLAGSPYLAMVEALAEHDRRANGGLVRTLEAYLDAGGALAQAAERLTVHRNTILYRLSRIEAIIALDLDNVEQRLNLHVALKAYHLKR
ncbi:MAG: PucR family transcriptional regulator ligand-binding domain-containing protein [Anaerolineales bacterium]|nr:PucR family transcriptional regulator ligand-binding domain-containing protein [Anaerolineales bacterium]